MAKRKRKANLKRLCVGTGYAIKESWYDTTNIVCRRGHVYADGDSYVACIDSPSNSERIRLGNLGEIVQDGDDGINVRFAEDKFPQVARIMRPRQAACLK
jgi:hypothetical protein